MLLSRMGKMTKPVFDHILGVKALRELRIVLDFWTKEITIDEIISPMRDINSYSLLLRLKKLGQLTTAWFMNQEAPRKPLNAIHILDAKYDKADLQSVFDTTILTSVYQIKTSC